MKLVASRSLSLVVLVALATVARSARADDGFPRFSVGGLVDARGVFTDDATSWLDEELGKTRFGGENGDRRGLFRIGQASLLLEARLTDELFARVQIDADLEPDTPYLDGTADRLHLIEGMISYRPVLSPHVRLLTRAGLLFPFSIENTATAWSPAYTITPSAANTWIGEDVRPTALELGVLLAPAGHEITLAGAAFIGNDPAGAILAWRGFALHDRLTGVGDRPPFANIPTLSPGGMFARNDPWDEPVREVDDRLGWWAAAGYRWNGHLDLRGFHYDNRADPLAFDGHQYGWDTRFTNVAAIVDLPHEATLIVQQLWGRTVMGPRAVVADFQAGYVLATLPFGRHRLTGRWDWFSVTDRDFLRIEDPNDESGWAGTVAYIIETGRHHRVAFEVLEVSSERAARELMMGLPARAREIQTQVSFRLFY